MWLTYLGTFRGAYLVHLLDLAYMWYMVISNHHAKAILITFYPHNNVLQSAQHPELATYIDWLGQESELLCIDGFGLHVEFLMSEEDDSDANSTQ